MVPPASRKISRVPRYSGTGPAVLDFDYRAFTVFGLLFQYMFVYPLRHGCDRPATPKTRRFSVWANSISLATTLEIVFTFFSSGYLDVSVHRVPSRYTMYSCMGDEALPPPGFPIRKSMDRRLLAAPRGVSPLAASFFGAWCQGIRPVLFSA